MSVFISEPEYYSTKAITLYSEYIGKVYKGTVPHNVIDEITVLVVRLKNYIDESYILKFPNLKYLISPTTGLNHICKDSCLKHNITIISLNDCKEEIKDVTSTPEHTIGLMLCLVRNIVGAVNSVSSSLAWDRDKFRGRQLSGLNLGIVGLGRIGLQVACIATSLKMNIMAYDPLINSEIFEQNRIQRKENLDDMLANVDILSINASLNKNNFNLIDSNEISKLKKGCFVINTARGELTNEEALVQALRAGNLGGIAVDVLSEEQQLDNVEKSPLVSGSREGLNIIITPHIGGCTLDSMIYTEIVIAEYATQEIVKKNT